MRPFYVALLVSLPACAGMINQSAAVTCGEVYLMDPISAQCSTGTSPEDDSAYASVGDESLNVAVWKGLGGGADIVSYATFEETFETETLAIWDYAISGGGIGPYLVLDLGPFQFGYADLAARLNKELAVLLPAGTWRFSATTWLSDQGWVAFTAGDPHGTPAIPEPVTSLLIGGGLLAMGWRKVRHAVK